MLRFGSYLLRFHLAPDWSRNNKHSRNFLCLIWCSRFYRKDCKTNSNGWRSITYVEGPYQLRLVFAIRWCHALRVLRCSRIRLGCSRITQLIGFAGEQFLLISSLLDSDYHISRESQSSHKDDTFFVCKRHCDDCNSFGYEPCKQSLFSRYICFVPRKALFLSPVKVKEALLAECWLCYLRWDVQGMLCNVIYQWKYSLTYREWPRIDFARNV